MPDKKAPVIVFKRSRLHVSADEPVSGASSAGSTTALTPDVQDEMRKHRKKQGRLNREKMAAIARLFPALWPDFDSGKFRPMKLGIKALVREYIDAHPGCGMTPALWSAAVGVVMSRIEYQRCVREGETRYDIYGEPAGIVTAKEAAYARLQVKRIKARLDAREKQNNVTAE